MSTVTMTSIRTPGLTKQRSIFEVIPARWNDMHTIANFLRSTAHWYRPIVNDKDMSEHDVNSEWAKRNYHRRNFYLGLIDGKAIGTVSLQYFDKYAYIGYIYLNAQQVGKGYGQKLMRFAESVASQKRMKGIVLLAHPEATWAKRAYLKYGFEIIASEKADVLAWQGGVLDPYYEEEFELYQYDLAPSNH